MKWFLIFSFIFIDSVCEVFYSPQYRKCSLNLNTSQLGSQKIERVPRYASGFNNPTVGNGTKEMNYTDIDFLTIDFIGAGGSGQVFLVEDEKNHKLKILKRFFKEQKNNFEKENFIMDKMNYTVQWHHELNKIDKSTIATYQFYESSTFDETALEKDDQYVQIFYKICQQILKSHYNGIIHNDLKMSNILVKTVPGTKKVITIQLIDWNLASFYFPGFESAIMKGTPCYYSPQMLHTSSYFTPAIDIWTLAVVFFSFATHKKPFLYQCKQQALESVLSLVGGQKFLQINSKYRMKFHPKLFKLITKVQKDPQSYKPFTIRDRIPAQNEHVFTKDLVDLLEKMLVIDPEERITITEVIHHPYFDSIKNLPKKEFSKNELFKKYLVKSQRSKEKKAPANNLRNADIPSLFYEGKLQN